jgi:FKBP-type peptidyl-prolyl cis-trans isomerase FkpA
MHVIPARLFRRLLWFLPVAALALTAACAETPTGPSSGAPYSQVDLRLGTGTEAVTGKSVVVNYTGWLYDPTKPDSKGIQFDSSVGLTPLTFTIGSGQVIEGFDRGAIGMKVGGARRIVIPPSLGYGGTRNNSIPPFATLVFEIELVEVVETQ